MNRTAYCFLQIIAVSTGISSAQLSYDNLPMGSKEEPLVLRTYVPDIGIPSEVFENHSEGLSTKQYRVRERKETDEEVPPIAGIPACIAVNYGAHLSFVWDTVECRLLYAWKGGFFDMSNYWGSPEKGNRVGFGYLPELVGSVTYRATGSWEAPSDRANAQPIFVGLRRDGPKMVFLWKSGSSSFETEIKPAEQPGQLVMAVNQTKPKVETVTLLSLQKEGWEQKKGSQGDGPHYLSPIQQVEITQTAEDPASLPVGVERGKLLYTRYGCNACHTLDGAKSHGPTFSGLSGSIRDFAGTTISADANYLAESITEPNAKIVPGYLANYMPKLPLESKDIDSLVLFIQQQAQ